MRKRPVYSSDKTITCEMCEREVPRTGPRQKYCKECSEKADLKRKNKWASAHSVPKERTKTLRSKSIRRQQQRGHQNANSTLSISEAVINHPLDFCNLIRVSVPFDYGYSKNSIYTMVSSGHIALRNKTRMLRDTLVIAIRNALGGENTIFVNAKIYLDIFVEKPNHKGDAVNVVDTVCDAVCDAIGIDDRWFSIRSLDWRIVKEDGRLFVGIGQIETEEQRACHRCGRLFPISEFIGIKRKGRVCFECRRGKKN